MKHGNFSRCWQPSLQMLGTLSGTGRKTSWKRGSSSTADLAPCGKGSLLTQPKTRPMNSSPAARSPPVCHGRHHRAPFRHARTETLEEPRIHAINTLLHGKRRPIAQIAPADLARSSRAQFASALDYLRGAQRPSGLPAAVESARRAESRQHDQALMID